MIIRTRFAPSPTGFLHIGSARTALYSWLFAKSHHGTFILRIEDTDLERSTKESVDVILEGMEWMKLDYEEGPFYQTQRMDRYKEVIAKLLEEKKAYRCYCSKERLEKLRSDQQANKQKPRYDGHCWGMEDLDEDKPFVVRFRNPQSGAVTFNDQVRGTITVQNSELDDLIIARSDGMPTYNFTVVIDDWDMAVTHVIRGDDHINNTPRQINIFAALDVTPPLYAHIPMILGSDGKRLSKRHGAVSVLQYRDEGYLPEALLNYLVRLGWSHGDQEIFSQEDMIRLFKLGGINRSPAIFNPEKLLWLNQHYLKSLDPNYIARQLASHFEKLQIDINKGPALIDIVLAQRERVKTLVEMAEKSKFFYEDVYHYDEKFTKELTPELLQAFIKLKDSFSRLQNWETESIHHTLAATAEEQQVKLGKIAQPLRIAVTGGTISPPIDITLKLLSQQRTLQRLEKAIYYIEKTLALTSNT